MNTVWRNRQWQCAIALMAVLAPLCGCLPSWSQTKSSAAQERSYPYSSDVVRKTLEGIGAYQGGALPMTDGFVPATVAQVEQYERPFYQYRLELTPATHGTSTAVRVEARISAWFADGEVGQAGYRALSSNGRLEADLLDRLQTALEMKIARADGARVSAVPPSAADVSSGVAKASTQTAQPTASTEKPEAGSANPNPQEQLDAILAERQVVREKTSILRVQIANLEAADRKPANAASLARVKRSGVGVMSRKNFGGPVLFRAQADDEFEVVTLVAGWAEVRLSPEMTGYVQVDELQIPEVLEKPAGSRAPVSASAADCAGTVARVSAGTATAETTAPGTTGVNTVGSN